MYTVNKPSVQQNGIAILRSKFRFADDIDPVQYREIESNYHFSNLSKYFESVEKARLCKEPIFKFQTLLYQSADQRNILVRPCIVRLGFNVKVTSYMLLPLEQMLNLEALNQFVLTGKIDLPVATGDGKK